MLAPCKFRTCVLARCCMDYEHNNLHQHLSATEKGNGRLFDNTLLPNCTSKHVDYVPSLCLQEQCKTKHMADPCNYTQSCAGILGPKTQCSCLFLRSRVPLVNDACPGWHPSAAGCQRAAVARPWLVACGVSSRRILLGENDCPTSSSHFQLCDD